MPILAENRDARFRYEILETLEAGVVLMGQEVKSIKAGRASLKGSFVTIHESEAYLTNALIPPWQPKNMQEAYEPSRPRKLLLHKAELMTLIGTLSQKGLTAIPLKLYTKKGQIKAEIGIVRHKKTTDQRETIKKREAEREMARTLKYSQ